MAVNAWEDESDNDADNVADDAVDDAVDDVWFDVGATTDVDKTVLEVASLDVVAFIAADELERLIELEDKELVKLVTKELVELEELELVEVEEEAAPSR